MGSGMAANLVKAGHQVHAFDLSAAALDQAVANGATRAGTASDAVRDVDMVVTMLPAGKHVRAVYEAEVFGNAAASTLLIDCSTIDVTSAKEIGRAHVWTPVPNAHLVCRLLLEQK